MDERRKKVGKWSVLIGQNVVVAFCWVFCAVSFEKVSLGVVFIAQWLVHTLICKALTSFRREKEV